MNLTPKEKEVFDALNELDDEGFGDSEFKLVYLDNGINTSNKTVKGVLGSLEKKGLYKPEDGYAWGHIKKA